jgi:hypothetical protein
MLDARFFTPLLIVLLLLGQGAPMRARAQVSTDGDAALEAATAAPPIYIVELVVFAYNEFNRLEEEFGPSTPQWPKGLSSLSQRTTPETLQPGSAAWYLEDVLSPREPVPDIGAPAPPSTAGPTPWYRLLDGDELELGRARARLNALGAYAPLLHTGWSQTTLLEGEARPFELARLGRLQPAGSIRLHRSRFLHLTVDVSLQNDYRYAQNAPSADSRWPLAELVGPVRYRIQAQRRVRIGELHFFDHPAFGILIVVRPAPADPASDGNVPAGPVA